MPIDPAAAVAAPARRATLEWDHRDVLLYHLGIGAGGAATDDAELRYTLESRLQVLPAFATVAGGGQAAGGGLAVPGIDVDPATVLHAEQHIALHRPIPVRGKAVQTTRVAEVLDRGRAAVIVLRSEVADEDGPLWTAEASAHVRGEGGFGGSPGPDRRRAVPSREPDHTVDRATRPDQALLYRLSGDFNPLHADPRFARAAGFERPILHGLCSYGLVLKAVVDTLLAGDATRVRSYRARFAGIFLPGETMRIRMWADHGRVQVLATAADRDDAAVLADTVVTFD
ncbi:MaoC/PaaZ C-terminal domain-containing protein [Kitasatospora sp. NPDC101235]|uniref:MaoC/PaaZ C-terminal domain-containing protein n=1 Tax=Kitasatospora sp. NPDC101235 TaxID=3364101 RepID=UPI00380FB38D